MENYLTDELTQRFFKDIGRFTKKELFPIKT